MAVLISDNTNPLYTGLLSPSGSWYRVEAYNLTPTGASSLLLSTERFVDVTFSGSCNLLGVVCPVFTGNYTTQRNNDFWMDVRVLLWENKGTVLISNGSPCNVTKVGHGLVEGDEVRFTTTGGLPTGLTVGTHYYVRYLDANIFNLSLTPGGPFIVTSSAGSGTHTLFVVRAAKQRTSEEITDSIDYVFGTWIEPFRFSSSYAVDTGSAKWQISAYCPASTGTTAWSWKTSNNTAPSYAAWGDLSASFSSSQDTLVIMDDVTIDTSFRNKSILGVGGAVGNGATGCWICPDHGTTTPSELGNFKILTPSASYTWTMDGVTFISAHGAFRAGTESTPIPYAQQFIINCLYTPSAGSVSTTGFADCFNNTNAGGNRAGLFLYGQIPSVRFAYLTNNVPIGAISCSVIDNTGFAIGDPIIIGGSVGAGFSFGENNSTRTVANLTGSTIIGFSAASATAVRSSGSRIYNRNGYGVTLKVDDTTRTTTAVMHSPASFVMSGVYMQNYVFSLAYTNTTMTYPEPKFCSQYLVTGSMVHSYARSPAAGFNQFNGLPIYGAKCNDNIGLLLITRGFPGTMIAASTPMALGASATLSPVKSGPIEVKRNLYYNVASNPIVGANTPYSVQIVEDNFVENGNTPFYIYGGIGSSWQRNTIKYCTYGISLGNIYYITDIKDNVVDACDYTHFVLGSSVILGASETGNVYGTNIANTAGILLNNDSYLDYEIKDPSGSVDIATAYKASMPYQVKGSEIKFTNTSSLEDTVYAQYGTFQRCGSGLTDTTVHVAAAGNYSLRMESIDGANNNPFDWEFKIPTGNISNKDMIVGVWCKINSGSYWSGSGYTMPKLIVNYDNGTVVSASAVQSTNWQFVLLPFRPATDFGQIDLTLQTMTSDATPAGRYVYWDDFSVLYPAGYALDLSGMNLWSNGMPITPPINTLASAQDVWAADPTLFGAATVGDHLKNKVLTNQQYLLSK